MQVITRELELENGSKVYFKTGPIHPYWTINFESGSVPDHLSGMYQNFDDAVYAVKLYVENRPARNRTTVTKKVVEKE